MGGYFKIEKVTEIAQKHISITLFHYKLHTKIEIIIENDIVFSFDNIASKTIFELDDEK